MRRNYILRKSESLVRIFSSLFLSIFIVSCGQFSEFKSKGHEAANDFQILIDKKAIDVNLSAFKNNCHRFALFPSGYTDIFGDSSCGGQANVSKIFSVTHEDENYSDGTMRDLDPPKYLEGRVDPSSPWQGYFSKKALSKGFELNLELNTIDYSKLSHRGRLIQTGHLFVGMNWIDPEISKVSLASSTHLQIQFRLPEQSAVESGGSRFMVGFLASWAGLDSPRRPHYLEVNLARTQLFDYCTERFIKGSRSELENEKVCDISGDIDYRSNNDRMSGGPELVYYHGPLVSSYTMLADGSFLVLVPVSLLFQKYSWRDYPSDWKSIKLDGIYLGLEHSNKARTKVEVMEMQLTNPAPAPSVLPPSPVLSPQGLFRVGVGGYIGSKTSFCYLNSDEHLKSCGYTQKQYDEALNLKDLPTHLPSTGACQCSAPPVKELFRINQVGYIKMEKTYCALSSGQHMNRCGFSQEQYDRAPQLLLPPSGHSDIGLCSC